MLTLYRHAHLVTLASAHGWGCIEEGALLVDGDVLCWVGGDLEIPLDRMIDAEFDLHGALVTPGLVDCHTHLIYGGDRAREFNARLQGASYTEIAQAGGGIVSTVEATRTASNADLLKSARHRMAALVREGVTTLEVKSGYGLSLEHEARCLRVARHLADGLSITVRNTCLAAHAVPPEFAGSHVSYIDAVCDWLPQWHAEELMDAVDGFCEEIAFDVVQIRRVFETAQRLGLPVKLHAEQLSDQGGAHLAAEFGALSCDHLEYINPSGIEAMSKSRSVAVLLPAAFYSMRETRIPPVAAFRSAGVPMALGTDHNPGTAPCLSPLLVMNMGCTLFRLTPEEALRGMTLHGAQALGLYDRGRLVVGHRADFVIWPLEQPGELAYWLGQHPHCRVIAGGKEVHL